MAKIYDDDKGVREQWDKLKDQPFKVKAEYFFQYYGLLTAIIACLIIAAVSITVAVVKNSRPRILAGESYALYLNTEKNDGFKTELCEKLGLDEKEYVLDIAYAPSSDTDLDMYATVEIKIMARASAQDLDFVIGTEKLIKQFSSGETMEDCLFGDLRNFLPAEQFDKLDALGRVRYATLSGGTVYPCYLDIKDTAFYKKYDMTAKHCYMAFPANAPHPDGIVAICDYFMDPVTPEE